ncbi:type I-E CRISPR-associated protein Cse1/CasA, partial [Nocardia sp. NPDC052278]|uniref:type I-E CRISPR-associated protein Cse1/CasA n=1 Tax=unclassified Nocardia TaxID=2637762 RepID=UPI0036C1816C
TFAEIVEDVLPMSVILLREDRPAAGQTASNAVDDAENTASAVWSFAENLAQAAGAEPKSGAGDRAREHLYAALDAPYREWLASLTPERDLDQARAQWQTTLRAAVYPIAAELISAAPPSAWVGRTVRGQVVNVARAEMWLNTSLRKLLPLADSRSIRSVSKEAVA